MQVKPDRAGKHGMRSQQNTLRTLTYLHPLLMHLHSARPCPAVPAAQPQLAPCTHEATNQSTMVRLYGQINISGCTSSACMLCARSVIWTSYTCVHRLSACRNWRLWVGRVVTSPLVSIRMRHCMTLACQQPQLPAQQP